MEDHIRKTIESIDGQILTLKLVKTSLIQMFPGTAEELAARVIDLAGTPPIYSGRSPDFHPPKLLEPIPGGRTGRVKRLLSALGTRQRRAGELRAEMGLDPKAFGTMVLRLVKRGVLARQGIGDEAMLTQQFRRTAPAAAPAPSRREVRHRAQRQGTAARQEKILAMLAKGPLGPKELEGAMDAGHGTLKWDLARLLRTGQVLAEGNTNNRRYRLPAPGYQQVAAAEEAAEAMRITREVQQRSDKVNLAARRARAQQALQAPTLQALEARKKSLGIDIHVPRDPEVAAGS